MMITSAARSQWHLDVPLKAWSAAGLRKPCVARAKLFTLDNRLIAQRVGTLAGEDVAAVVRSLREALPLAREPASNGQGQGEATSADEGLQ